MKLRKKHMDHPTSNWGEFSPNSRQSHPTKKNTTVTLAEKRGHHGFPSASRHEKYRGW